MPARAFLNGEPATGTLFRDRACQFGDGLFETLAVRNGTPCLWGLHMQRLERGCERLGLPPVDRDLLFNEAQAACANLERGALKIVVSAGPSQRGYARPQPLTPTRWIACEATQAVPGRSRADGLRVQECTIRLGAQPYLAGIKHLNRLEQVLARAELADGMDEGLLYDQSGSPVEGIASNLLVRTPTRTRYVTPALDGCGVAGTVRQLLIDRAEVLDHPLEVRQIQREELFGAEGLFMINALMGIQPVAQLGEHCFPQRTRPPALERLHRACFTFSGDIACNA